MPACGAHEMELRAQQLDVVWVEVAVLDVEREFLLPLASSSSKRAMSIVAWPWPCLHMQRVAVRPSGSHA